MGPARIRDATRIPRAARAGWISVLAGLLGIGVGGALTIISSAGATTQPELRASVVECSTTVTYEVAAPDGDDAARTNGSVGVWWREGDATGFAPAPDELPAVNSLTRSNGFTFSGTIDTRGAPASVITVRAAALEVWGDGASPGDAVFATVTLPPTCDTAPPPAASAPPPDATAPPSTDAPTTTLPPVVDPPTVPDDDGVPAEIENGAPNSGDGNADGIPDAEQANVASLPSRYDVDGNGALDDYVTIEAPPLTALANVRALAVPAKNPPPDGVNLPAGLFDYDLDVGAPGQAADVRVLLPDGEQHVVYMLLDGIWRAFDDHASIDDAANQVTLHVVDGGPGDRSGADGVINDPFGVGAPGGVGTITFTKVATGGTSTTFNVQLARCVGSGSPPGTASTASDACSSVDSIETSTVLGGQSTTSGGLNTDNHWYRLRETPSTSGWTLSARSCTGGQSSTTSGAPSDGTFVRLNGGAGAVCTFTNASNSITARKGGVRIPGQNTLNTFVQGIDGAAFEYATNSSFSSGLADLCTTSSTPGPLGTCTQGGISNGSKYVREKTSPAGWEKITTVAYGGGPNGPNPDQAYSEQTSNLTGTTAATTRWFMNRMTNPPLAVDTCGLKIGLLLDKSQSISGFQDQYIQAAQSFVSTLANTPTQMKLYSFGINAQTYNGGSFYDLANSANVSSANTQISNIYSSLEAGTNWDAGLQQVGSAGLDVLFVITDGNPIMWQGNTSGATVDLADVEAGIASANLVKSFGQRVVSIGVGDVTATNISLLSGPTQGSDYFTGSVAQLQQTLKNLAVSLCGGSVTVKKEVRTGPGANDFAAASGWQYGVNPAATTVTPANGQTNQTGTVNFDYAEGPWPKTVTVTETQQSGWSIVQQDGDPSGGTQLRNAACTIDGALAPVTDTGNAATPGVSLSVDAQDIVACTFRNQPTTLSQIQVVKTTNGGAGGPFAFGATGPNGTNATRNATTATAETPTNAGGPITGLYPGQYTISESSLPAGWDLAGITCTGATDNGTANLPAKSIAVTIGVGQTVTCTYTNSSQVGQINVVKKATGASATFPFALTQNSLPVPGQANLDIEAGPATPADDGTNSWTDVAAGTYAVSEATPAGWDLTSATCSDGSPITAVEVSGGETVTCTFSNTKRGIVILRKIGVGEGEGAQFDFSVPAAFGAPGNTVALTTQTGGSTESSTAFSLPAGTYPVTEQGPPPEWDLSDLVCDDGSPTAGPTATIELAAGENVVCTWTNTKRGSVTIEKVAVGSGPGAQFDFSVPPAFGAPGNTVSLTTPTDGGNDSETFTVAPGSYEVTEDAPLPDGWDFTDLECTNGSETDARTADIEVAAGESVTCTWTNTKGANVTIEKIGVGLGAGADFDFSVPAAFGAEGNTVTLTTPAGGGNDVATFSVAPGTYEVTEDAPLPEGWDFTDLECTNDSNTDARTADIEVAAGESVTCTWTNTKRADITIEKVGVGEGGGDDFVFDVPAAFDEPDDALTLTTPFDGGSDDASYSVQPGIYTVTEQGPPGGWDLTGLTCTNASPVASPTATIQVAAGESVTCTWTNTKHADLTIEKVGVGEGAGDTFDFAVPAAFDQPDDTLSLTTPAGGGTSSETFRLPPGASYSVTEDAPPEGWVFTGLTCDAQDAQIDLATATVTLAPGEAAVCTWTNTKQAQVTIVKDAIGEGAGRAFGFDVPAQFGEPDDTLTLTTPNGGGTESSTYTVPAGTYDVTEQPLLPEPSDWVFTGLECTNDSGIDGRTASIEVVAGEVVTCTWTNTQLAQVTLEKVAIGDDAATFDFAVPAAFAEPDDTLALSTAGGGGSADQLFVVPGGTYTVSEDLSLPDRWEFTSLTCTNASVVDDESVVIEVDPGEQVTCTWTNTQRPEDGNIVITKLGVGAGPGATFDFTVPELFVPTGELALTTPDGGGSDSEGFVVPPDTDTGYAVSELVPPVEGWDFTDLECTDPDGQNPSVIDGPDATIFVSSGETVTCTWTNTKRGDVTIVKEGVGSGAGASFDFSVPAAFGAPDDSITLTTPADGGTDSSSFTVVPGTYQVTEDAPLPAGWDFTDLECSNGSETDGTTADVDVAAGESVTCTWTNTKRGDVTIEKVGVGVGAGAAFDFDVPDAFDEPDDTLTLTTPTDGGSDSQGYSAAPGTYEVTEQTPLAEGWEFTSLTCTNGSVVTEMSVDISVAAGESVTCTWTNTKQPGNVTIVKTGVGTGAGATFDFSVPAAFLEPEDTLALTTPTDGGSDQASFEVPEGTYDVTELGPPAGWDLTDLDCTNDSSISDATAQIEVAAGEEVTCTWTNTKRGDVTIEKVGVGAGDSAAFDFSVPAEFGAPDDTVTLSTPTDGGADSASFSVTPNTYEVTEDAPLPEGWDFTDLECTNDSETDDTTAHIEVAAGESVTCTWTNTKRADVTIEKVGVGVGAGAEFGFDVPGVFDEPDDTLTLTTPEGGGSDDASFSVVPGTYEVAEQAPLPDGWEFTSLTCTNGSIVTEMSVQIAAAAGESVTCTWTNTKLPGSVVLEKTAIGEDAESFDFSVPAAFEQPDDTVSLSTPAGGGTVQSSAFEVPEGTYAVSELGPPAGWDLTDLTCTNQSQITLPTADIEVAAGGEVTCTWTNTQRADVTVEKVAIGTGPGAAFAFEVPGAFDEPGDELTLTTPAGGGSDAQAFSVPPGAYAVTEQSPPAGWQLTGLSCTNGSEITSPTATITVAAGESVTCTWTNTATTARVEVVKQVAGADVADWTFDGQVSGGTAHFTGGGTAEARTTAGDPPFAAFEVEQVPAAGASVHLAEQLQVGYGFAGVSCVVVPEQGEPQPIAANPDGATATPVVTPDQVVRCTFVNNLLPASISLVKTASASQVNAGSDTSFSIVVTNDGQVPLTNVVVTDPVPTGTTFVSATVVAGQPGVCSEAGGLVTCTLDGTLEVGETSTISLVVNVPAAATPFTIVNSATVTGDPPVCVPTTDVSALVGECPVTATDDATVPVIGVGGETVTVDAPRVVAGTLPFTGPAGAAALKSGAWLLALGGIITLTTRRRRATR